jgi:hypothetical protein
MPAKAPLFRTVEAGALPPIRNVDRMMVERRYLHTRSFSLVLRSGFALGRSETCPTG